MLMMKKIKLELGGGGAAAITEENTFLTLAARGAPVLLGSPRRTRS